MPDFETDPEPDRPMDRLSLSKTTWVQLGTVLGVLAALWVPYQWLDARFKKIEGDMIAMNAAAQASAIRMDDATRRIEAATADQWTRTDQRLFLLELALRNRTLVVPPVESKK